jgi:hypothetical protein
VRIDENTIFKDQKFLAKDLFLFAGYYALGSLSKVGGNWVEMRVGMA